MFRFHLDNRFINYSNSLHQNHLSQTSSNILWHGIRIMFWGQLYPTIVFLLDSNKAPKITIIHCGGNNIGHLRIY